MTAGAVAARTFVSLDVDARYSRTSLEILPLELVRVAGFDPVVERARIVIACHMHQPARGECGERAEGSGVAFGGGNGPDIDQR